MCYEYEQELKGETLYISCFLKLIVEQYIPDDVSHYNILILVFIYSLEISFFPLNFTE